MRIVSIGFFWSEYPIALANALTINNSVTLFLSKQNLAGRFPNSDDLQADLRKEQILNSTVSLCLIDYPKGHYFRKVVITSNLVHMVYSLQPDVIHYQSGGPPWIPFAMPWLRRFPLVATIHDASPHSGDWSESVTVKLTNFLVSRFANQIIVHGHEQADKLRQTYCRKSDKINVILIGSLDMYKSDVSEHPASDFHNILFFGRLRAYKGLEILIRAASLIAAAVPDMRVIIAGAGEYPAVQKAAIENPSWFEVHNRFIEAEEVPDFFQRSALVVLPYLDATQTGIVNLSYQFSRPVVATRVGSIPEIVDNGKTGYLVNPRDERGLADAIIRLLLDRSLREKMGKAAKAKLEEDLSWDAIALKTQEVYERAQKAHGTIKKKEHLIS